MIENKSNQPLNQQTGTVPDVSGGMLDWFQPLAFVKVIKQTIGFQLVETKIPLKFQGVVQFENTALGQLTVGQRGWLKMSLHAAISLSLQVDEIVEYQLKRYRVLARRNFTNYGYFIYDLLQDWGEIPSPISYPLKHTILQYGLTLNGVQ